MQGTFLGLRRSPAISSLALADLVPDMHTKLLLHA
jgi:hypothetical protein